MQSSGNSRRVSPVILQSAVGLMILTAFGALIFLILWLKNIGFGGRSYRATIVFPNAGGMTVGTRVAYRGVKVGQVRSITPEPEGVKVEVEISPADRLIPSNSRIEATQAGLVGETTIDITPLQSVPGKMIKGKPLDSNCNGSVIICNGSVLQGLGSLDVNTLIRSLLKISNLISDPQVTASIRSIAQRSSVALSKLGSLGELSSEATVLLKQANRTDSLGNLNQTLGSLNRAAGDISELSEDSRALLDAIEQSGGVDNINSTLTEARNALLSVGQAAEQVRLFMVVNQDRLIATLDSVRLTSDQLRTTVNRLDPLLAELEKEELIENIDTIIQNSVELTGNLQNFSAQLNDPQTILQLQKILDSARSVFENVQKLTSDLDELTGDPQLRRDLIRLIQGLSDLVSSTQQLHQQVLYAQSLNQIAAEMAAIQPTDKKAENGDKNQP